MNKVEVEGICSIIGEVCPLDFSDMEGGDYLWVWVVVDISKPLNRGRKITLDDGLVSWVFFKFGWLPNICYWCGCLTHRDKDYDLWLGSEGTRLVEAHQYEAWMRAPLFNLAKKSTVVVPGFYKQRKETSCTQTPSGASFTFKPQNPPAKQSPLVVPNEHGEKTISFPLFRDIQFRVEESPKF